jgi:hypothetical protein
VSYEVSYLRQLHREPAWNSADMVIKVQDTSSQPVDMASDILLVKDGVG